MANLESDLGRAIAAGAQEFARKCAFNNYDRERMLANFGIKCNVGLAMYRQWPKYEVILCDEPLDPAAAANALWDDLIKTCDQWHWDPVLIRNGMAGGFRLPLGSVLAPASFELN